MLDKKAIFPLFIILVIAQLFVPVRMMFSNEQVIKADKNYKFKTAPIDPNDPLRGKYITLRFDRDKINVSNENEWDVGTPVFCTLSIDNQGFAILNSGLKIEPPQNVEYLSTSVEFASRNGENYIIAHLPFDRYYMNESKAYEAEQLYRLSMNDSTKITYALVAINRGKAVLKDVMINGESIKNLVATQQ